MNFKNVLLINLFFIPILMQLSEVVVPMHITNSPSFIKIGIKTKEVLLIAHFLNS